MQNQKGQARIFDHYPKSGRIGKTLTRMSGGAMNIERLPFFVGHAGPGQAVVDVECLERWLKHTFDEEIPNETTVNALEDALAGKSETYSSVDALFEDLAK